MYCKFSNEHLTLIHKNLSYLICVKHQSRTWCSTTGRSTVLVKCSNCCRVSTGEWDTCDQADLCQFISFTQAALDINSMTRLRKRQNKKETDTNLVMKFRVESHQTSKSSWQETEVFILENREWHTTQKVSSLSLSDLIWRTYLTHFSFISALFLVLKKCTA